MIYKNFRLNCIIRTLTLVGTIFLFIYFLSESKILAGAIITGILIIYQVYKFIFYVEKTNRDLARFFQSIKYEDFAQTFRDDHRGPSFSALKAAFTDVISAFRQARAEKEEHYRYLQTIVQHIGIGLIAFQPNGKVELFNTAAKKILKIPRLKNIKSLECLSKDLVTTLFNLKPREKVLIKIENENELLHLALYATEFKLSGQKYSLVSIQNIHSELEEKELEAWQKLIRVLTHEIMNSLTPIVSLASTLNELIHESYQNQNIKEELHPEYVKDIDQALNTIKKRSEGLLHFVNAYRNLTLIPKPKFQIFSIKDLFFRVEKLMEQNLKNKAINFETKVEPESLELTGDPELIEQVLINLLLNSLQAVKEVKNSWIKLEAYLDERGRIIIQVKDNGPGIPEKNIEKVFIPFFSTKEGGSGIGLSLSRQIMRLHNGTIGVHSKQNVETVFTLRF